MSTDFTPIFLDLETSGLDRHNHSILSLAILVGAEGDDEDYLYLEFKHPKLSYTKEALDINGFDISTVKSDKLMFNIPNAIKTTLKDSKDIIKNFLKKDNDYVLCGFNVGTFDYNFLVYWYGEQFINRYMSYRTIDLNSFCYFEAIKQDTSVRNIKGVIVKNALQAIPTHIRQFKKHNSLTDAFLAREVYKQFIK